MKKLINISIIVIFVLVGLKYLYDYKKLNTLNSNYGITVGVITKYYEIGLSSFYMEYSYKIKDNVYKNEVNPDRIFKNCEDTQECINNEIFVKYSIEDPTISRPIFDSLPPADPSINK